MTKPYSDDNQHTYRQSSSIQFTVTLLAMKLTTVSREKDAPGLFMNVIQLTDFHLFDNLQEQLHGHCTYDCLNSVVNNLIKNQLANADALFITGDISQDGTLDVYKLALTQIERLQLPTYVIAGNHDKPTHLNAVFNSSTWIKAIDEFTHNDWLF